MDESWRVLLMLVAFAAAYTIPRYLLTPERQPWQVWLPAGLAMGVVVGGAAIGDWGLAAIFGVVLPIEIWRTLPTWRALRAANDHQRPPLVG
jgi:hypothetical protein